MAFYLHEFEQRDFSNDLSLKSLYHKKHTYAAFHHHFWVVWLFSLYVLEQFHLWHCNQYIHSPSLLSWAQDSQQNLDQGSPQVHSLHRLEGNLLRGIDKCLGAALSMVQGPKEEL